MLGLCDTSGNGGCVRGQGVFWQRFCIGYERFDEGWRGLGAATLSNGGGDGAQNREANSLALKEKKRFRRKRQRESVFKNLHGHLFIWGELSTHAWCIWCNNVHTSKTYFNTVESSQYLTPLNICIRWLSISSIVLKAWVRFFAKLNMTSNWLQIWLKMSHPVSINRKFGSWGGDINGYNCIHHFNANIKVGLVYEGYWK